MSEYEPCGISAPAPNQDRWCTLPHGHMSDHESRNDNNPDLDTIRWEPRACPTCGRPWR